MYNSYITSTLLSFRTKGSLPFSFNNDCSNLFDERFDCNPFVSSSSRCCSCCNCCSCCCESSFGTHRLALSSSLVYGLRQSSLIQFLPSRRLINGVKDRGYYRFSGYGVDHGCEVSFSLKEKRCSDSIKKQKFSSVSSSKRQYLSGFDNVDAVLSLLSEEVSEECLGDGERNVGLLERGKTEKRSNYGGKSCRERKKNSGLGSLESSSKCEYESVIAQSQNEARKRKEERERRERRESREEKEEQIATLKGQNRRRKQSNSSISSYYSLSSAEDFESQREGEEESGSFLEESSSEHRENIRDGVKEFEGRVGEKYKGRKEGEEKHEQVLLQHTNTARTYIDWDLRKKSEKKLSESEEMQYSKESSQMHARTGKNFQSDYEKSSLQKQIVLEEEKSHVSVDLGRKTQYGQTSNQISEQSEVRRDHKGVNDMQEIHDVNVETTSHHQKRFSTREEGMTVDTGLLRKRRDECHRKVGKITGQETSKAETEQFSKRTDTGASDTGRAQGRAVSRINIREDDKATSSNWETDQSGEWITGKIESGNLQKFSGMSNIRDSYTKNSSSLQSGIRKKHERDATIVSTSGEGEQNQRLQTDQNSLRKIQPEKGCQDVTNVSMLQSSDSTSITNSQNIYVKGSQAGVHHVDLEHGEEGSSQVMMMPPSPQLLDKSTMHVDSSSGITAQEITRQTVGSSMGAFEFSQGLLYGSSGEGTAASYQEPGADSGRCLPVHVHRQAPAEPPIIGEEPYGRDRSVVTQEQHLSPHIRDDSLGSAHRLEESAAYFVGEFIDKANDVLTSRIPEDEASDAKLVYEGQKHTEKSYGQHSSEGLQLKDGDSRQSSGVSVVKDPSDEMWHVTDPTVQETRETEAEEGSMTSENTLVRRTGGSLWSIISNIVRLRWGSRAETPKSAGKSGGKSSSNDSVRSETWFSGRDNDEISDGNGKGEKTSMLKEASSSRQLQQSRTSSQGQISDASGSKETTEQFEEGLFSPSIIQKSGSSSKRISSPSEGENLGWSENGKSSQIIPSGIEVKGQPVISLPSSGISRPIIQESLGADESVPYGSRISEGVEQHGRMESPEVSGSVVKVGELKQRRLQRSKQVVRDRFEEWEEAYLHESEQQKIDEMYMREALLEAKKAADFWEVPVGAVLVHGGKIIARGYNLVEELRDSTAHAEMICIREASNQLRTWRLAETTLYVTLEPCPMCAGAILQARIDTLVWGAPNKLLGANGSWITLFPDGGGNCSEGTDKPLAPVHPFHPNMKIRRGILSADCAEVMQKFFQLRRRTKQKEEEQHPQPSSLPSTNRQSKFLHRMHNIFDAMFCL